MDGKDLKEALEATTEKGAVRNGYEQLIRQKLALKDDVDLSSIDENTLKALAGTDKSVVDAEATEEKGEEAENPDNALGNALGLEDEEDIKAVGEMSDEDKEKLVAAIGGEEIKESVAWTVNLYNLMEASDIDLAIILKEHYGLKKNEVKEILRERNMLSSLESRLQEKFLDRVLEAAKKLNFESIHSVFEDDEPEATAISNASTVTSEFIPAQPSLEKVPAKLKESGSQNDVVKLEAAIPEEMRSKYGRIDKDNGLIEWETELPFDSNDVNTFAEAVITLFPEIKDITLIDRDEECPIYYITINGQDYSVHEASWEELGDSEVFSESKLRESNNDLPTSPALEEELEKAGEGFFKTELKLKVNPGNNMLYAYGDLGWQKVGASTKHYSVHVSIKGGKVLYYQIHENHAYDEAEYYLAYSFNLKTWYFKNGDDKVTAECGTIKDVLEKLVELNQEIKPIHVYDSMQPGSQGPKIEESTLTDALDDAMTHLKAAEKHNDDYDTYAVEQDIRGAEGKIHKAQMIAR